MTKKRYCIQYEAFVDDEWITETHTIMADVVDIAEGVVRFENTDTTEEFMVSAENLIAAWTGYGDH